MEEVESYVHQKEIRHRVYFLKDVPWYELPGIYSMSKCLVYPSLYEGFGLPIIEALKMGVPVVAANNSSLPEAGGEGATFEDALDVDGWADAINRTMLDTQYAQNKIEKGSQYIQRFSPQVVTSAMVDLYSWVYEQS